MYYCTIQKLVSCLQTTPYVCDYSFNGNKLYATTRLKNRNLLLIQNQLAAQVGYLLSSHD